METQELSEDLIGDRPLSNPSKDRLGHAGFAEKLAESLCQMPLSASLTIGLYGSWGSGKTTLVNFLEYYLQEQTQGKTLSVMHFNPWLFSGAQDLTQQFFEQLLQQLETRSKTSKDLREKIYNFAESLGDASFPLASGSKVFANLFKPPLDVNELKAEIETGLKEQQKPILVIIDDIDRLAPQETAQLFRVIAAVANFPKLIYLLLLDREVVINGLTQILHIPGQAYLEKIIQVPLTMPICDRDSLRQLLQENLDFIFAEESAEIKQDWNQVLRESIAYFLKNPRDIGRLASTLRITYTFVQAQVNPVDFVALEALRLFCLPIYDLIRRHPDAFLKPSPYNLDRQFYETSLDTIPRSQQEPTQKLLVYLFPKLKGLWQSPLTRHANEPGIGLGDREAFSRYFQLAAPRTEKGMAAPCPPGITEQSKPDKATN
ncbi:MAG: AAA family ATPase [Chloroflexaceae bacterium]|nr:AAA family ATPase [Chloroflexaceae bacterium]